MDMSDPATPARAPRVFIVDSRGLPGYLEDGVAQLWANRDPLNNPAGALTTSTVTVPLPVLPR